ncbi:hypothetical protein A1Q2_06170 [Trichosporon asahii var. asahii CBS 8904]|uniref:mRNA stability protein n=2 Tax=Trichosporon asahii var. asahii TaxID=189963 RepID=K1V6B9_TRIAC|nr:hypothetical protein A1Q1_02978 [Trichosporon asahii var. asahii CBS 2479]EJT48062.1 hypothetical protein A1Q1_02978 [Trichosporon asahii var. asahii CBS 2479]EKC99554.1 hypothetical protein A1Q2_06170 [Trichosporon asahii var. asahii CBS 8904]
MNPHKMNKVDLSQLNEQEQKAFQMYGKLPQKNLLSKINKERKYFDSGDYMMSKAGVSPPQPLGTAIPTPEGVPHASPPTNGQLSSSPTNSNSIPDQAARRPSQAIVGMGISPAAESEAMGIPGSHQRRGSERCAEAFGAAALTPRSHSRISPPGTFREGVPPQSSYPIHHGNFGSSPVKTSALARRTDEEM